MNLTKGYAPWAVFFQGWASTPRQYIVDYEWDFGAGTESDPHGRYIHGFNSAHVFEHPGTYNVRLRVKNSSGIWSAYDTLVITVMPGDAGTTFYVDSSIGSDTYDGKCQTVSSTCGPWKTATRAFQARATEPFAPVSAWEMKPGDRVLFKRGLVYEMYARVAFGHGRQTQGNYFGAYGNPTLPKPIIQWTGPQDLDNYMIGGGYGKAYWAYVDLQFKFVSPTGNRILGLDVPVCAEKNLLYLRVDFFDPYNGAVGTNGATGCVDGGQHNSVSSFFLIDSSIQNPSTHHPSITQSYFFGAHALAVVGNHYDKSGNHMVYSGAVNKAVVYGNTFSRPAFGRTIWRSSGAPTGWEDNNLYFAKNLMLGWIDPVDGATCGCDPLNAHNGQGTRYNYTLLNFGPGGNSGERLIRDVVFENNVVTNFEVAMDIINAENMVVRNNLFVSPAAQDQARFIQLSAGPGTLGLTRPLKNVSIVGNDLVSNGPGYTNEIRPFVDVVPWTGGVTSWGATHDNVDLYNNLFYALSNPTGRVAILLEGLDGNLLSHLHSNHNLFYLPGAVGGNPFQIGTNFYSLSGWSSATGLDPQSLSVDPHLAGPLSIVTHQPGEPATAAQAVAEALQYENALRLTAQSPLGTGLVLPVDAYFDFLGIGRYQIDGTVDVGAFEYQQ